MVEWVDILEYRENEHVLLKTTPAVLTSFIYSVRGCTFEYALSTCNVINFQLTTQYSAHLKYENWNWELKFHGGNFSPQYYNIKLFQRVVKNAWIAHFIFTADKCSFSQKQDFRVQDKSNVSGALKRLESENPRRRSTAST